MANFIKILLISILLEISYAEENKNPLIPLRGIVNSFNKITEIEKKLKKLGKKDPNEIVFKNQEFLPLRAGFSSLIDRLEEYEMGSEKEYENFLEGIQRDKRSLNESSREFIQKYEPIIHQLLTEYNSFAEKLEKHGESRKAFQENMDELVRLEIIEKPKRSKAGQEEPTYTDEEGEDAIQLIRSLYEKHRQLNKHQKTLAKYSEVPEDELERDWIDDVRTPAKLAVQELEIEIVELIDQGSSVLKAFIPHIAEKFRQIDEKGLELMEKYKQLNSRWLELTRELMDMELDINERIEQLNEILRTRRKKKKKQPQTKKKMKKEEL